MQAYRPDWHPVEQTYQHVTLDVSHASTGSLGCVDLLHRLNVHLVRYPSTTLAHGDRWDEVLREHEELLTAIEAGDPDRAHRIAEEHMTGAREVRLRMYVESSAFTPR